jgi:hypothetical protein
LCWARFNRPGCRATQLPRLAQRGDVPLVGGDDGAEQQIGVAAHRLGRTVHDNVGAERQRALQQRRGKRVVDHAQHPALARGGAQTRQVGDAEQRIRG